MSDKKMIVRFAPSPTGLFHVGSLRTALFNFLIAKKHQGTYILRIEDTDKERSKPEYEQDILSSLEWLGINHDSLYRQSEHVADHTAMLHKLVESGKAYVSNEAEVARETVSTKANMEGRRDSVIRFKNPNKKVLFKDLILDDIEVDTTDLGDFVIAKDFDTPLYNFAVVCDDMALGVTHVIRGQDHISNTPRQILLYEAFGATAPTFAHIPLILAPDKSKLSKRKHGAQVAVATYKEEGFLPEALLNFMALIGWNPGDEREVFTLSELVQAFSWERVQKSSGIFNTEKLHWINKEHLKKFSLEERSSYVKKFLSEGFISACGTEKFERLAPTLFERINFGGELRTMEGKGELAFVVTTPTLDALELCSKESTVGETKKNLEKITELLSSISEEQWNSESVKSTAMGYADGLPKRAPALHPMRYALTGLKTSPDPFTVAFVLGKAETLSRLAIASNGL